MLTDTDALRTSTRTANTSDCLSGMQGLHARSRESRVLFSPCEMAHLGLLRWLFQVGRLAL
jgi:hypothetical protein